MNPLVSAGSQAPALLALENGMTFAGYACGAEGDAFGEMVFNTSMTGYQEIVTDPSYAGQIVTLTYPQIGNYGINAHDSQSDRPHLRGLVVRDMCHTPSNWQCALSLPCYLREQGVVAIEGVDTRAVTLAVRGGGAMRAGISTTLLDPDELLTRVRASAPISATNHVDGAGTNTPYVVAAAPGSASAVGGTPLKVVAYDCGEKEGIVRQLAAAGCEVSVVPWDTPARDVLAMDPNGVFFSNGPGDPELVTATAQAARELLGRLPVFGICLGNQIITLAAGGTIEKLPYGHHGGNEPVMNLLTGQVEITAQNHNYGPDFASLGPLVPSESDGISEHVADLRFWCERRCAPTVANKRYGRIRLTHVNLNDGTPEGMQFLDIPAFSSQYHPEAKPGPNDSTYFFRAFARLMAGCSDYLEIDVREGRRLS